MLKLVFGCDYEMSSAYSHNCAINVFDYDGEKWNLLCWDYMNRFDPSQLKDDEKVLFLVRHGQSEANLMDAYGGQYDWKLTPKGIKDAENIRPILAYHQFDKVYCSDLSRAICTQQTALPGRAAVITPLVREIDEGDLVGTGIKDSIEKYGNDFRIRRDYTQFIGESAPAMRKRIEEFLQIVEKDNSQVSIVFAHNGTMNTMLEIAMNADYDRTALESVNCGIHIFMFSNKKWRLVAWNYMYSITE